MNYWIIKQEPEAYSFATLQKDKKTEWTGVRNYQARNNLKAMQKGDLCLFYHSVSEKAIVGIAKVTKTYFQDPTTDDTNWVCVEVSAHKAFKKPVPLELMRNNAMLTNLSLIRQSRLSVCPITVEEFDTIIALGN